jgi:hypothetical protein
VFARNIKKQCAVSFEQGPELIFNIANFHFCPLTPEFSGAGTAELDEAQAMDRRPLE